MAFIENTAFLPRRWNNRNDDLQNQAGQFGSVVSDVWTPDDCSAGFICVGGDTIPGGGRKMLVATNGVGELFACNPGDVQRGVIGGQTWAVGVDTLHLGVPAGKYATYSKLKVGECYAFAEGNFTTVVTTTNKYATIANGLLVGTATKPTAAGSIYFELDPALGIDNWTEANLDGGPRYNLVCKAV